MASSCGIVRAVEQLLGETEHAAEHGGNLMHNLDDIVAEVKAWLPFALNGVLFLLYGNEWRRRRKVQKKLDSQVVIPETPNGATSS